MKKNKPKRKSSVPPKKAETSLPESVRPNATIQQFIGTMIVKGSSHAHFSGAVASEPRSSGKQHVVPSQPKKSQPASSQATPRPEARPLSEGASPPNPESNFDGFVVKVDLVGSEKHAREIDRSAVPGAESGIIQICQWCERVWDLAKTQAKMDDADWRTGQPKGEEITLVIKKAKDAHEFGMRVHAVAVEQTCTRQGDAKWRFRVGIAHGKIKVVTGSDGRPRMAGDPFINAERLRYAARSGGTLICVDTFQSLKHQRLHGEYGQECLRMAHPKPTYQGETIMGHPWPRPLPGRDETVRQLEKSLTHLPQHLRSLFQGAQLGDWHGDDFHASEGVRDSGESIVIALEGIRKQVELSTALEANDQEKILGPLGWIVSLGLDHAILQQELDRQLDGKPMSIPASGSSGSFKHPRLAMTFVDVRVWIGAALSGQPVVLEKLTRGECREPNLSRGISSTDKAFAATLAVLEHIMPGATMKKRFVTQGNGEVEENDADFRERIESEIGAAVSEAERYYREGAPFVISDPSIHEHVELIRTRFSDRVFVAGFNENNFTLVCRDHLGIIVSVVGILRKFGRLQSKQD